MGIKISSTLLISISFDRYQNRTTTRNSQITTRNSRFETCEISWTLPDLLIRGKQSRSHPSQHSSTRVDRTLSPSRFRRMSSYRRRMTGPISINCDCPIGSTSGNCGDRRRRWDRGGTIRLFFQFDCLVLIKSWR